MLFIFNLKGNVALLMCMADEAKTMDSIDGSGNSPLHTIIKMPRPPQFDSLLQVVQILLEMGVSAELRDKSGKVAVEYVDQSKDPKVFQLLNEKRKGKIFCNDKIISMI
jgi:ankyrin repeat protein